ncbi:hypothetical protein A3860_34175 [Niastella vici]|uniref:LRAT domain-containing protein n=1 Tax=Niastella vici TaxID=1703345 RepID=A0A1V9FQ97_9BACT|nr:lecithin retinol acyltransferase family protein [Niastella vici]OQP60426.1 hypothetical protein A3860_34175 [Niastella vici]
MTIQKFILQNDLQQADVIVLKKKFFGMLDHFAVFLGYNYHTGVPLFAANYTKGTQFINQEELASFLTQLIPERIERFNGNNMQRQQAIERAISRIGANDYNYFSNNCEHYKNFVQSGTPHSEQSKNFENGIAFGAVILLLGALLGDR